MAKLLTHKILGLAVAYYVLKPRTLVDAFIYGGLALIGSMIPDLDTHYKHRIILHNLFACLASSAIILLSAIIINHYTPAPLELDAWSSAEAYMLAYLAHLLTDIPTGRGVAILYPLSRRRASVLGLKYDNTAYNAGLVALATWMLYIYFTTTRILIPSC